MNDEWEGSRSEGKRDQGREKGRAGLIKDGGDESRSDHGGGGKTRMIGEGGERIGEIK